MAPLKLDSILILGAGELGSAILTALATHISESQLPHTNHPHLTVLLRPSSKPLPSHISDIPISIIRHDIAPLSPSELSVVLKPYDTVISCTGYAAGPGTQLKITRAALEAGTKRYFPWQFGVDYDLIGRGSGQDLWDEQLNVRELLRSAGAKIDWVIVSTGIFTSFALGDGFGVVDGVLPPAHPSTASDTVTVRALGSWTNELTTTSVEDIAKVTSHILFDDTIHNQVVYIAGDTITYARLAEVIQKVLGPTTEVKKELWTQDWLDNELEHDGANAVNKYRVAFAKGRGLSWPKEGTYNSQRGIEVDDIETWLRKRTVNTITDP